MPEDMSNKVFSKIAPITPKPKKTPKVYNSIRGGFFVQIIFNIEGVYKKEEEIVSEVPLNLSIVNTMFILIYSVYSHLLMDLSKYKNHKNKMKE